MASQISVTEVVRAAKNLGASEEADILHREEIDGETLASLGLQERRELGLKTGTKVKLCKRLGLSGTESDAKGQGPLVEGGPEGSTEDSSSSKPHGKSWREMFNEYLQKLGYGDIHTSASVREKELAQGHWLRRVRFDGVEAVGEGKSKSFAMEQACEELLKRLQINNIDASQRPRDRDIKKWFGDKLLSVCMTLALHEVYEEGLIRSKEELNNFFAVTTSNKHLARFAWITGRDFPGPPSAGGAVEEKLYDVWIEYGKDIDKLSEYIRSVGLMELPESGSEQSIARPSAHDLLTQSAALISHEELSG